MFMNSVLKIKNCLNFSEYSINSEYYDNSNKKVIGKMKDEVNGIMKLMD